MPSYAGKNYAYTPAGKRNLENDKKADEEKAKMAKGKGKAKPAKGKKKMPKKRSA